MECTLMKFTLDLQNTIDFVSLCQGCGPSPSSYWYTGILNKQKDLDAIHVVLSIK